LGGIDCPEAAWTKIKAGATLLQLYSALVFKGPALIGKIKRGLVLAPRRERRGFACRVGGIRRSRAEHHSDKRSSASRRKVMRG